MTERELRNYKRKLRRQKEIRRKIFLTILSVCIILTCVLSYGALVSNASAEDDGIFYKYFTSIEVESGDTLWTIAEEYKDENFYESTKEYVEEVIRMNNLSSTQITAGQFIIIPYYSTEFVQWGIYVHPHKFPYKRASDEF